MKKRNNPAKRVLVAMSGGVDSSVAAALLKDSGYEVIGATMKVWSGRGDELSGCCSLSSIEDARKVAGFLGIPHYVLNAKALFKERVIDPFAREYISGTTPNPCIECNRSIKFGYLLKKARELGCDFLATGHYAVIKKKKSGQYSLFKAMDHSKDQSYVLYMLGQAELKRVLFPLGCLKKEEVRALARRFGLHIAEKEESQEICFVEDNDYAGFIREHYGLEPEAGPIVDSAGKRIGSHSGIINYTLGQRRGLGVAAKSPLYVSRIDVKNNVIVAGSREDVLSSSMSVRGLLFVRTFKHPKFNAAVKIRYRHKESPALVVITGRSAAVNFKEKQWAVTPGQSAVFYKGKEVVGGGIITSIKHKNVK